MKTRTYVLILTALLILSAGAEAQEALYSNEFPLGDITITGGPLKHASELNLEVLLEYDTDRLIAPFRKEAGLPEKASLYPNWAGLDGHVGGHYLSALAMNYASTGNAECKKRMDYFISELKACQDANTANNPSWGKGYIGGVPDSKRIWSTLKEGNFSAYRSAWVPWYNVHKLYSGLRDAWLYSGNEEAKRIFIEFCDWGLEITSGLSDEQMQVMLDTEHGGMNEIYADAFQMTGDEKYIRAARRFSHNMLLDAMADGTDNLDNKHANTQVPKAVGFQRIAELTDDDKYSRAGRFFWETVTGNRSLAFGGNSRREFFPGVEACTDFVVDVEGPETCNSYNMLKLTENLFRVSPLAEYSDYYERTMFNHILSTQHPDHGGYVYFTPVRPRHYRVYSAPNEGMWCCVGSGMENHGKYNQFIYTHSNDSLFLNLFVESELNWRKKGIKIVQETRFPDEEQTRLRIKEGKGSFTLMVRYPSWVSSGDMRISINGKDYAFNAVPSSYIAINRKWKKGDEINISLPMHLSVERMPNVPQYVAIMYGPILLGARTGKEDLKGLVADDGRWSHIAAGERLPVDKAPVIIEGSEKDITAKLTPVSGKTLTFSASDLNLVNQPGLVLEPFFRIHDERYMVYWMWLNNEQYTSYLDSLSRVEKERTDLQRRTVDFVAPGEQQPEADHLIEKLSSGTGNTQNEFWRDARNNGYFSYLMSTNSESDLSLLVRYWGAEWGNRSFNIYIDDTLLVSEDNTGRWNQSRFFDIEYPIPNEMVKGKNTVRVRFQALPGNTAGAVSYLRLVRKK